MNTLEFQQALERGLGRAIQHLRNNEATPPYLDAILDVCLNHHVFDPQCNDSLGPYLFEAIKLTGKLNAFGRRIRDALLESEDTGTLEVQLVHLVASFAAQGDNRSKRLLRLMLQANPQDYADHPIAEAFPVFDGLEGLFFVLDTLGQEVLQDKEFRPDHWVLRKAREVLGEEKVNTALEIWGTENPTIAAFLNALEKETQRKQSRKRAGKQSQDAFYRQTYLSLRPALLTGEIPSWKLGFWGRQAKKFDLKRAARDLALEPQPDRLCHLLAVFGKRAFPLDHSVLIQLAQHENDQVSFAAVVALEQVTHPDVRKFAFHYIGRVNHAPRALGLLEHNYQPGDHGFIETALNLDVDDDTFHAMTLDVLGIFEANPVPEALTALTRVHERGACLQCRFTCLRHLESIGVLPDWMIEEALDDASSDIREWAARKRMPTDNIS